MSLNFKHALLAGTAIVAVGAFGAQAQAADQTLSGNAVWGTAGNGMAATPTAGDNVIMTTHNLQFDTTETGVLTAGAITATTGDLTINTTGDAGNVAFTIGSFTGSGTADITVDNLDASTTRNVAATFTGAVSTGGALIVRNTEVGGSNTSVLMTVGGNTTITGTTAVTTTGTGQTGTTATLDLNGASNTFTGAVTVTGGADAATNDASLNIAGNATFTGGLTLTNGAAGQAILNLDGTGAQTIAGAIAGNGDINVTNNSTSGVAFTGNLTHTGPLLVNNNGSNQAVSFTGNLASALTLGNNAGTDTVTATFGGTGAQAISGAIAGGGADTSNLVFSGGNTKTITGAVSAIDNTTISGSTTVTTNQNFASTNITVGSGSTLATTANTITATSIANSGTLALNGGSVTSAITGTGLLDVNNSGAVNGAITQGTADIAAVTLTQTAASGYTVGSTNFSGAGTLALAAGTQAVTGSFTNTTDGQGTITVADGAGTTTITGNVGASTSHSLASFQSLGGTGQTVALTGNLFADAIAINDADTLRFQGTSAQTVSGNITDGILVVGNGGATDVTFNGTISSGVTGTVASGAVARYNGATNTFAGAYTNTGTSVVGAGSVLTSNSFSNTGSYVLTVSDANGTLATADFGRLVDSDNGSTITNSRLTMNVVGDIGTGANILLLTGINAGAGTLVDNSIQYTFVTVNDGADTDVTVTRATSASLATGSNTGVATTLDGLSAASLAGTANAQISTAIDNLSKAPTQEAFNEILETLTPSVDGGAVISGFNASTQSIGVVNDRLASLRGGSETSMVAGEMGNGLTGWIQGFGQLADQDARNGVDGYEADTYGVAIGLDTANILEQGTVGASLGWANSDVDSKNAARTNADVDSYQVSVYGNYDVAPNTYLAGTLGYAWNDIDQTRHNVGGTGLNADADYDSDQYIAYAEVGHDIAIDEVTTFTPHVLAHYQHISIDNYLETGAGGLNQNVSSEDLDVFELGVGAEVAWDLDGGNGSRVRPALNVGYRHDLADDNISTTSNFTGGGAAFNTNGLDPADGTFNVGASIGYALDNNWEFTADYDYQVKSDYDAHSGFVRAGYKF